MFPERLEDYIADNNAIRVIDAFVDGLDLRSLQFKRIDPLRMGRQGYRPATLLKLYVYGYLNCIQSSRRLEQETIHNVELMWLLGRLQPDFKTIADFRKDNDSKGTNRRTPLWNTQTMDGRSSLSDEAFRKRKNRNVLARIGL